MKLIKLFPILLILISLGNISTAQVQSRNYLHEEYIADIKSRTLWVELLKEDPTYIDKLTKDGNTEAVKNYKRQIVVYNGHMKRLMPEYWKLNTDIDFKYADEIKALKGEDAKKYAVLLFTDLDDVSVTDVFAHQDILIPTLQYHRADKPYTKPDVKMPIPASHLRDMEAYEESDIIIAIMLLQDEVQSIEKDKISTYKTFLRGEGDKNCNLLKGKKLVLDETIAIKDFNPESVKTECILIVRMADAAKINDMIYNNTVAGEAALVDIPVTAIKPLPTKPGAPVTAGPDVVYAKLVIDLKTFKLLSVVWPSIAKASEDRFNEIDFKKLCKCPD